jgi:hypothetical protein
MQRGRIEIDLLPSQVADLRRPQPVPVGHKDHAGVSVTVAIVLCRLDQLLNLSLSQVLPVCTENLNPHIMVMKSAKDRA